MPRILRILSTLALFGAVSCVTINIYFPAEQVRGAADRIVDEVWGERAQDDGAAVPAEPKAPGSSLLLFGPATAYAQQDINVSTPEIRAIRESMKERSSALFPYLDSGHVGIGRNGLLEVRTTEGLDLKGRGEINRLVAAENKDRQQLYKEIARANGFPEKSDEVQAIFAETWRDKAAKGWYIQQADGGWVRK